MNFLSIISVALIVFLPLIQVVLGVALITQIYKLFKLSVDEHQIDLACAFVVGLFVHLLLAFLLKVIGLHWSFATLLPLIPAFLRHELFLPVLSRLWPAPRANFLIWFFIVSAIGLSIIGFNGNLYTAWSNNYGDSAFHIGMISSFVFGENFPPQYHIFSGSTLSYPFLINFWTAMLWWIQPSLAILPFIFFIQWLIVWLLVYRFLSGAKYFLLPWVVLFGGGTYKLLAEYSYHSLNEGYPWVAFLGSIWIPQRTFLLGLVSVCFLLWIAYRGFFSGEKFFLDDEKKQAYLRATVIGLFSGFGLITHGHAVLLVALFIGLVAVIDIASVFFKIKDSGHNTIKVRMECIGLIILFGTIAFAFVSPWLLAKTAMFEIIPGWLVNKKPESFFQGLGLSSKMWFLNAGYCVVLLLPAIVFGKYVKEAFVAIILFLTFNFIRLSFWDWDQIKLFITLFVILAVIWGFAKDKFIWRLHLLTLVLIIPGALEAFKTFQDGPNFTIYTNTVIEQANRIKESTEPDSIIAAAPDHNSLITLTGRKLYSGYPGSLWTHGLDSREREERLKDFNALLRCKEDKQNICPDYLAWSDAEKRFWPGIAAQNFNLKPVVEGLLYRIP